jgi:hypothetical protein
MSGKEVIRAAQMFTTTGVASRVSVVKEIAIATVLGIGAGMWWQVRRRQQERMSRSLAAGSCVFGSRPAPAHLASCCLGWFADLPLERVGQVGELLQGAGGEGKVCMIRAGCTCVPARIPPLAAKL